MAEIIIGGKLPARLVAEFMAEVNSTGAKVGRHDGVDAAFQDAERLHGVLDDNGHLLLVADDTRQFDALAAFCVKHGIAFDRRNAARNICFRADMIAPTPVNKGSEALLDAGNIRSLAKEVARLVTVTLTRQKLLDAVTKVIRQLHGLLPPELPPLEIGE
jgi:hypothetical protein